MKILDTPLTPRCVCYLSTALLNLSTNLPDELASSMAVIHKFILPSLRTVKYGIHVIRVFHSNLIWLCLQVHISMRVYT